MGEENLYRPGHTEERQNLEPPGARSAIAPRGRDVFPWRVGRTEPGSDSSGINRKSLRALEDQKISMAQPAKTSSSAGLWCPPPWLGFLWGFAEGTLFFVIPDIVLSWASLAGVKCGTKILGAILAGAVVAGLCLYLWAARQPDTARSAVASVPFVRDRMFSKVEQDYRAHGVSGIFYTLGTGIPYKVYAVLAPPVATPAAFGIISILGRFERMALSWLIPTFLGWACKHWIRRHRLLTTVIFAGFWIVTYAIYWGSILINR